MDKDIKNVGKFEDAIRQSALNEYLYSFYQKDLPLVLEIVDKYIDDNKLTQVNLADIGGGPGSITQYLKENSKNTDKLTVTCLDSNKEFLVHNHSADIKIETDLTEISHVDSWDIGIMRYVLHYNEIADQIKILKNIRNGLKENGILINWNVGLENEEHQERIDKILSTNIINERLIRPGTHWDTIEERKEMFKEAGFIAEVRDEYRVEIGEMFKIRYELTDGEFKKLTSFLGDYDFATIKITVSRKSM